MAKAALPTYEEFARLRLHQFVPKASITTLKDWEYLGCVWVGEADGFTTVLQLESDQTRTRAVAVDLDALPAEVSSRLVASLSLALRRGMTLQEIIAVLGKPTHTAAFDDDRATHEFTVGEPPYYVSCTVMNDLGLIFATMNTPLPESDEV